MWKCNNSICKDRCLATIKLPLGHVGVPGFKSWPQLMISFLLMCLPGNSSGGLPVSHIKDPYQTEAFQRWHGCFTQLQNELGDAECLSKYISLHLRFFHLKGSVSKSGEDRDRSRETDTQRERDFLPIGSFPTWPDQPGVDQAKVRSQEYHLGIPSTWTTFCCVPWHKIRNLDWKCNHWDSDASIWATSITRVTSYITIPALLSPFKRN